MGEPWPLLPLGHVLVERRESPVPGLIESAQIKIVGKIRFDTGDIELRSGSETKTGMVLVRPGDMLVSGINVAKGAIALYDNKNHEPIAATIHYGVYRVLSERADRRYLWWYLRSGAFRSEMFRALPGGIKTELKASRFLPLVIPVPPLEEQRRIVAQVEAIAAKVEDAKRLRRASDDEAAALVERHAAGMRSALLATWRSTAVGQFTRVSSGATPDRKDGRYWDRGEVPWVKTGELGDGEIFHADEAITETAVRETSAKILQPGTLLVAMYGQGQTRGRTALLRIPAATNQACAAVHPSLHHVPEYLQWWYRSLYTEMRAESRDGAQPNWNAGMIRSVRVALPPIEEQHRVAQELGRAEREVKRLVVQQDATAAALDALLPAVLNRAFQGEL